MLTFAKRNMLVYVRDRSAVFFSLLAVLVLIALYVFFLGDLISSGLPEFPAKDWLLLSWIIAGVVTVASVTTTMGAFGVMVDDKASNAWKDFSVAPVKRSALLGGYIASSLTIGFFICAITLFTANLLLLAVGEPMMTFIQVFLSLAVILLSVLASGAMVSLLISFFRTSNAFAAASTLVGTLLGFLAGIYIPIGSLPGYLQTLIQVFPVSHSAALLRQILMEPPMAEAFAGAPAEGKHEFLVDMGVIFEWNGWQITPLVSVLYLLAVTALFFGLSALRMRYGK